MMGLEAVHATITEQEEKRVTESSKECQHLGARMRTVREAEDPGARGTAEAWGGGHL